MNAIQKFKEDRKILKAQGGIKTSAPVEETIGDWVRESNRSLFGSGMRWYNRNNPVGRQAVSMKEETRVKDANGREWILKPNGTKVLASLRNPKPATGPDGAYFEEKGPDGQVRKGRWQGGKKVYMTDDQLTPAAPQNTGGNAGGKPAVRRTGINWGNEFTNFMGGLSQEQQDWLKQNGLDNAQALQTYLNANNYYDGGINNNNVDNKFGGNSKTAWNKFVASGLMGKNRDLEILAQKQKEVQPVVDAPDPFGYESKGNYALDNARTLKTNGIRDWTTMMNYIKGNQESAFAQDMMHRFGSDLSTWKQEDVEGAIGVSGHYGSKDRSRIQGFMAGNQATWNNQRQAAINDYAKKTFLANPSGANTLGNQPGLSKEWAGADGTA